MKTLSTLSLFMGVLVVLFGLGSVANASCIGNCPTTNNNDNYCELSARDLAEVATCRGLANDLPTVKAYKARQAEKLASTTTGHVASRSASVTGIFDTDD